MPLTQTAKAFRTIIKSLFENAALEHLDFGTFLDIPITAIDCHDMCEALSHLFRVNRSLFHMALPALDLRGQIDGLLEGLGQNTTLKSLDFKGCLTNAEDFIHLQESLVNEGSNIPLEHIGLPSCPLNKSTGFSLSWVQDFFRKNVRTRRMKTVDFGVGCIYMTRTA
jgi:hypothetical protein